MLPFVSQFISVIYSMFAWAMVYLSVFTGIDFLSLFGLPAPGI